MVIRRLIVPLTLAAVALHAGQAFAHDAFGSPFPPEKWSVSDGCMKGFTPLREEAGKRGKLIIAASERHAPPNKACKLIGNYSEAELKIIKYIDANAAECGSSAKISDQLKARHRNTESMQKKIGAMANRRS